MGLKEIIVDSVDDYVQLTARIATSGQPRREQFVGIAKEGYVAVINLAMADSNHAVHDEAAIVTGLGLRYHHIPVPFDAPNVDQLREFLSVMRLLEDRKVWVHCVRNWRASAFMYHYLRHEKGASLAVACSPMLDEWLPLMSDAWQAFLVLSPEDIDI
jgi:protein tyrosine phosphatase (PTP) superfamily phosphohydrolase (DUF442 family)